MEREEVRRVGKVQQSDMAYVQLAPPGQQRQAQGWSSSGMSLPLMALLTAFHPLLS